MKLSGYTSTQLRKFISDGISDEIADKMRAEIIRRDKVSAGDVSVMTPGERLRTERNRRAKK